MASPKSFSMQGALDIGIFSLETNCLEAYLEDCLTTNIELTAEKVYTMGKGGSYITGFSHSKRIPVTVKHGYPTTEILAIQSGQEVVIGTNTNVVKFEKLKVTSVTATTTYTALGTAGAEIGAVYLLSGKSFDTKFTQAATVAATKFTYTPGTKVITFDALAIDDNEYIIVAYNYTADATAQTIKIDTDTFAGSKKVVMTGDAVDNCTDKHYKAQLIFRKMDISDDMTLALDETGEPIVMDIAMQALASCESDTLMEWVIFDEDLAI